VSFGFFIRSLTCRIKLIKTGKKQEVRNGNVFQRLKNVITLAFGQSKLLRDKPAGILHFFIFWGFILFLFSVAESFVQGFYKGFSFGFLGYIYSIITVTEDIIGILVLFSVSFALYRRFIRRIPRLEAGKKGNTDALVILLFITAVVLCMFGQNISHLAIADFRTAEFEARPVILLLSRLLFAESNNNAGILYEVFWWGHVIAVLGFMNYLPYSKHFHIITAIPNVYFANSGPDRSAVKALDLEDENCEVFGAADIKQLSWKQLLDGYTCTECGRCTASCPAAISGKSLSPKKIITSIRCRLENKDITGINGEIEPEPSFLHDYIPDDEIWQCTTCMACMEECPVMIEHLDTVIDMRRYLVLTESNFPGELKSVFNNLENNFNPWAVNFSERADWSEGLGIKTMAEDPNCDLLYWVGCPGSFDSRYKKVSTAFVKLMQKADINFRILGNEEKCCGDAARRLGNEYLAQMLIKENIETLERYRVKKIVTSCPHCYNSFKNEYKQFGGNFEVIHHTRMLEQLVNDGRLVIKDKSSLKTVYHDSCYLGRYNNEYDAPRNILLKTNNSVFEPENKKNRGFCCGAGGGRAFLEEAEGKRINVLRTKELIDTQADVIASACPFCLTMLTDGLKQYDSESVFVKDIAEILLEQTK
jgi:Fe-S oxidoreductase/nitrate reductase gamma subunit